MSVCSWCIWYVSTGQACGVLSFPLKCVLGLNLGSQACLPRVCVHWFSPCYPEKCVKWLCYFFFLFFLIACFISEFPALLLLLSMDMLLNTAPAVFFEIKREQLCSSFSSVKQIVFKMGFFTFKWNVSFVRESLKWFSWGIIVSFWVTGKVGTGQSRRRLLWLTAEDDGLDMHDRIFSMWKEGHLSCGSRCPD